MARRKRVAHKTDDAESRARGVLGAGADDSAFSENIGSDVSDTGARVSETIAESLGMVRESRHGLNGYTVVVDGDPYWIWEPIAHSLFRGGIDAETLAQHIREMRASLEALESEGDGDGS